MFIQVGKSVIMYFIDQRLIHYYWLLDFGKSDNNDWKKSDSTWWIMNTQQPQSNHEEWKLETPRGIRMVCGDSIKTLIYDYRFSCRLSWQLKMAANLLKLCVERAARSRIKFVIHFMYIDYTLTKMQKGHIFNWKKWKEICLWAQGNRQGSKAIEMAGVGAPRQMPWMLWWISRPVVRICLPYFPTRPNLSPFKCSDCNTNHWCLWVSELRTVPKQWKLMANRPINEES
jgi:hypothetical protein